MAIDTSEKVLALANVINPGGQRLNRDGSIRAGAKNHETNCALVAIATAAFLQDGTEAGAFAAPSEFLLSGNSDLVGYVSSSKTLGDNFAPRVRRNSNPKWSLDDEVNIPKKPLLADDEFIEQIKKIVATYPGQSFLVHGMGEGSHHWFNITKDYLVVDIQNGTSGNELLICQASDTGQPNFDEIEIFPVDPDITGAEIIASAQGLHQFNSMMALSNAIDSQLKELIPQETLPNVESTKLLADRIIDPYLDRAKEHGIDPSGIQHGENTPEFLNAYCQQRIDAMDAQGLDGKTILMAALSDSLTQRPNFKLDNGYLQTWLSESKFREPGSLEPAPSVVEHFADRCPLLNEAINNVPELQKTAAPNLGTAVDR